MVLNLADVLEALIGYRPESVNLVITEASIDSRQCIAGSLFVAISGERVDGHNYVGDAFHKGACIALVEKNLSNLFPILKLDKAEKLSQADIPGIPFCIQVENTVLALQKIAKFWRAKLNLRVVGITGSVGKSTTKELITDVLNQKYRTLKNPGNMNNEIGLPLTLLRLSEGYERAVLEMGFYVPGEIALLCDIAKPQVGVITNIGTVHAERAGSQDEIARGKAELIKALPPAPEGIAILNYDDPRVRPMAKLTQARVINYGLDQAADIWADDVVGEGLEGIRFNLHYQNDVFQLRVPLIGQHSVHTALRAAAVGLAEGLTWGEIITGLRNSHSQLRLVAVYTEKGALLLDDTYNASPESSLAALNLLEELDGRKIAVLGDMLELGQYEEEGHELVGARAAEVVTDLITIGPRGKMIASSAMRSNLGTCCVHSFDTAMESIGYLQSTLSDGDVVLIKGSHSMHMDQIVFALEKER
jgi:UDP-N-acetylmuramoyl-tripeptide--D-alanyl-D-alanine ligase